MRLYWVVTPCGFENWFVIAKSKRGAERYHEIEEGFGDNYAQAELVCNIPLEIDNKFNLSGIGEDWPTLELLQELGCKIHSEDNPRVVNFNGKVYVEGTFTEGMFFQDIGKAAGLYVVKIQNSHQYKIGITTNIERRIKQFKTGNPLNLKIVYFVKTKHFKSLEKHLHTVFKVNRTKGEWFNFNDYELEILEENLYYLVSSSNQFKFYNIKACSIQGRVY